jgi:hypothetical protein
MIDKAQEASQGTKPPLALPLVGTDESSNFGVGYLTERIPIGSLEKRTSPTMT